MIVVNDRFSQWPKWLRGGQINAMKKLHVCSPFCLCASVCAMLLQTAAPCLLGLTLKLVTAGSALVVIGGLFLEIRLGIMWWTRCRWLQHNQGYISLTVGDVGLIEAQQLTNLIPNLVDTAFKPFTAFRVFCSSVEQKKCVCLCIYVCMYVMGSRYGGSLPVPSQE